MHKIIFQILLIVLLGNLDAYSKDQISFKPKLFVLRDFLTEEECDYLIQYSRPYLKPAVIANEKTSINEVNPGRICTCMFFPPFHQDPIIAKVEAKMAQAAGLPITHSEHIQVVNYQVGGLYRPHYDYFNTNLPGGRFFTQLGGQRMISLVVYLNRPKLGGETVFPLSKISIAPVKGDAILFYDTDDRGQVDPSTLHAGAPVLEGEKWIATAWFRERPYRAYHY
ncbi:MAG: 2OG-Fe(II) oxygenase [Parachlamydiales bacterium]|jgi:prolyl 4-hydroxylase